MALSPNINNREQDKFKQKFGETAIRTTTSSGNILQTKKTTITTSATLIVMPEKTGAFIIKHITANATVWIGENDKIVAATGDTFPLRENDTLTVNMKGGESNEFYAIVASGSVDIYAAGVNKT